jgi:hypothetical protein
MSRSNYLLAGKQITRSQSDGQKESSAILTFSSLPVTEMI